MLSTRLSRFFSVGVKRLCSESAARIYSNEDLIYMKEPLFRQTCILLKYLFHEPVSYFIFDAIIMNLIFFFTVDHYREKVNMAVIYWVYYMCCFSIFLNIERQGLACIIVWYSLHFIEERKIIKFFLAIIIAGCIHNSALLFMVLYGANILSNEKIGKYVRIGVFSLILISPIFFQRIIDLIQELMPVMTKYSHYFKSDIVQEGISLSSIYIIGFLSIPILVFHKSISSFLEKVSYLVLCFILQIVFYFLEMYIEWGNRLIYYLYFGVMVLVGAVCKQARYPSNRKILKVYFFAILLFYYIRRFYVQGSAEVFPYQTIWN